MLQATGRTPLWLPTLVVVGTLWAAPSAWGDDSPRGVEAALSEALMAEVLLGFDVVLDRLEAAPPGLEDLAPRWRSLNEQTLSHAQRWLAFAQEVADFNRPRTDESPAHALKQYAVKVLRGFHASSAALRSERRRYLESKSSAEEALDALKAWRAQLERLTASDNAWMKREHEELKAHRADLLRAQGSLQEAARALDEEQAGHTQAVNAFNRRLADVSTQGEAESSTRERLELSTTTEALVARRDSLSVRAARLEALAAQLIGRQRDAIAERERRRAHQTMQVRALAQRRADVETQIVSTNGVAAEFEESARRHKATYGADSAEFIEALLGWLERPERWIWYATSGQRRFSGAGRAVSDWYTAYDEAQANDRARLAREASRAKLDAAKATLSAERAALATRRAALSTMQDRQSKRAWARSTALDRQLATAGTDRSAEATARGVLLRAALSLAVLNARAWIDALSGGESQVLVELRRAQAAWEANAQDVAKRTNLALPQGWKQTDVLHPRGIKSRTSEVQQWLEGWLGTARGDEIVHAIAGRLSPLENRMTTPLARQWLSQVLAKRAAIAQRPNGYLVALGGRLFELETRSD